MELLVIVLIHDLTDRLFGALVQFKLEDVNSLRRAYVCVDTAFVGAGFRLNARAEELEHQIFTYGEGEEQVGYLRRLVNVDWTSLSGKSSR